LKYRHLQIIFLLFFLIPLTAQKTADSLKQRIKLIENSDTKNSEYVKTLHAYCRAILYSQPEEAITTGKKALEISREIKDKSLEAMSYSIIGSGYLITGQFEIAKDQYMKKGLEIAREEEFTEGIASCLNGIASAEMSLGNYNIALEIYQESSGLERARGDTLRAAIIEFNIASLLMNQGQYEKAFNYLLESVRQFEKSNDKPLLIRASNNLAVLYHAWGNIDQALKYYQQSVDLYREEGDSLGAATPLNNIGEIYKDKGDYEKAVSYYQASNRLSIQAGNQQYTGVSALGLGEAYRGLKKYDIAMKHLEDAERIFTDMGFQEGLARTLSNIAAVYFESGSYENALTNLNKSESLAKQSGIKDLQQTNHLLFSKIYEKNGNFQKSLEEYKIYATIKDTLFNEEKSKKIAEMDVKYQTEIKEKENILLRKNNEIKELEIIRHQTQKRYFLAIAVLILILSFLLYRRYRQKQRINVMLQEKNEQISQQRDRLSQTLDELRATQEQLVEAEKMASLGSLVTGVAHEINTPVGISITAISSLKEKTLDITRNYRNDLMKRSDLEQFLQTAHQSTSLILKNLQRTADMVQSFKQVSIDQSTEQERKFNLKSYLNDVFFSVGPRLKEQSVTVKNEINDDIEIFSYPGAFASIFTNLTLNSVIHGFSGLQDGIISAKAKINDQTLIFEYSDNGNGISPEILPKIFDPFFTTNKNLGTGLGLNITYNLITQKLHGSIECTSTPGEGAKFTITLPVKNNGEIL